MNSGMLGADVVDAVLKEPARAPQLYREFDKTVRRGVGTFFSWLIYRMTSPVIRKLFMAPRNVFGVQERRGFLAGGRCIQGWSGAAQAVSIPGHLLS